MQYSVEAGGKRLRPVLCLAACEAVGGTDDDALYAACALEFIHTYSLIHDDLPAMDDDDLRRGKPTCHQVFGEATAILAGDALLTAAFSVLATDPSVQKKPERALEVIAAISKASGVFGMVQGQLHDMALEGKDVSWDEAQHMHALKTGALIEASVITGALLGGGTSEEVVALRSFGQHIGLAFQVVDDILNVEGETEVLGKPVGSDEELKKASAPAILGLDAAKAYAQELIAASIKDLDRLQAQCLPLRELATFVVNRKK
jgi:geranylgeranyl diphosphate synthase type II